MIYLGYNMQIGQRGKALLKEWEGLVTHEYLDSCGKPTIGIGHLLTKLECRSGRIVIQGQVVDYRDGLTEQQCYDLLSQDLDISEKTVSEAVTVTLNQNQFDALVSFVFNIGSNAFRRSTLLRVLNKGQYNLVPTELRRWVNSDGHAIKGLINRREKEITLWNAEIG